MCGHDPFILENIVTGNETWCYQLDPESKRQLIAWCSQIFPRPKKSRLQKSKVKKLLIAFFNNKGIIHKEFVPADHSINAAFYQAVWTDCYSVSGGFGQSCTGLENECCSMVMPQHTVRSVRANFWLRRWWRCLITFLKPLIWLLGTSSCFHAWSRTFCGRECHQRSCDSCSAIDSIGGLF